MGPGGILVRPADDATGLAVLGRLQRFGIWLFFTWSAGHYGMDDVGYRRNEKSDDTATAD